MCVCVCGLQAVGLLAAYPPLVVDEPSKLRKRLEELCSLFKCDAQQVRVDVCVKCVCVV
jgi:hypothetical protein